ncbi:hypothetical protein [Campylobacter estrildidarum]|uniref:Periplasmic protein n=1 Tax=Campylobacter estrildidarum TaxID=2510189 RepID=A0A4U7BPE6_9BACT|nr:hypothetical protein [Campylobacter estrildidarum]TKX32090.1 hypothetical protein CQA69_00855 [Campylobacter estrildidarum]
MKKLLFLSLLPIIALADCASLMAKYEAPEPESKTMKQIERWVNKKVKDAKDAAVLKECMVARAADNPNQVSVAGK